MALSHSEFLAREAALTAREAAALAGVQPGTIRLWRYRGLITPLCGTARKPLYDALDILRTCGSHGCTRELCAAATVEGDTRRNVVNAYMSPAA